ncbi:hypothetical protein [Amycolatopsis tucumanensis]|uniref:Uncharacterized protein n=1 Tax=Amycolatopsis tucumanensis TaxID=401106 RepID=A0ABP7I6S7_9PSEU|nr:hypothetical protein [Amycolatopsis tucumanensis]MCF6422953.1 hypothetical protein [Amycolatopsis tucumanensis]
MAVSRLVRAELARHDWGRLRCGCGQSGAHLPGTFETILEAAEPREALGARLDNHLEISGNLFEVAVPAVEVILAALAGPLPDFARVEFLDMLAVLVSGDSYAGQPADLGEHCRLKARNGLWTILQVGYEHEAETARDILWVVDPDQPRSGYHAMGLGKRIKRKRR